MYEIAKEFEFDYSHRVFVQEVNPELSLTNCNKCRWPHGHRGKVIVYLSAKELDDKGMVFDFVDLNFFKKFIDDTLDHKCILSYHDPSLPIFYPLFEKRDDESLINFDQIFEHFRDGHMVVKPEIYENMSTTEQEIYGGLVFVDFVPTSENLSKWLWQVVDSKIGHLCKVSRIQFFETPKSQSNYYAN